MQNYILYGAYGSSDHINKCRYSLLKLLAVYNLKPPADMAIVIYTDKPAAFEAFTSFFNKFEMKELNKRWTSKYNSAHRIKIELLSDFFILNEGNVLYCDADTYPLGVVDGIFNHIERGGIYMYEYEGTMNQPLNPALQKLSSVLATSKTAIKNFEYTASTRVWNTAVLGINHHLKNLLPDILALTDALTQQFSEPVVEQLSFSYHLQQKDITSGSKFIAHYTTFDEFSALLETFFSKNEEESIPNLVKAVHHIDAVEILRQKEAYEQLPLYKKWMAALRGKKWSIKQYQQKI